MQKIEKLTRLLYCLQGCYNETVESIDSNSFLTNDERTTCKLNIFILRKTLRERIMEQLQIHDVHSVNNWINYLLSIDTLSMRPQLCPNRKSPIVKPNETTRYTINSYAIQAQLKLLLKTKYHTHTLDQYLPIPCGSPDHQESIKDEPLTV